jgi:hypothetical protein
VEDVGTFYGHLVYFKAIWNILWLFWSFGIFFGMLYQEKSCSEVGGLKTLSSGKTRPPDFLNSNSDLLVGDWESPS